MVAKCVWPLLVVAGALCPGLAGCAATASPDSVARAKDANAERFADDEALLEASEFLVEMADARMMDALEGEIAATRGTSPEVRAYGQKMMADQRVMLAEIRQLAAGLEVTLPEQIGAAKADGLADLQSEPGEEVDESFISMIRIDHKRDVKAFREATELATAEVAEYARRRLPTVESHLAEIEAIEDSQ